MQKQHVRHVITVVVVVAVLRMPPTGIILEEVDLPFNVNDPRLQEKWLNGDAIATTASVINSKY